jgi:hypothetical protein
MEIRKKGAIPKVEQVVDTVGIDSYDLTLWRSIGLPPPLNSIFLSSSMNSPLDKSLDILLRQLDRPLSHFRWSHFDHRGST